MAGYDPVTARELPMSVSQRPTGVIEEGRAAGLIRRELPAATTAGMLTWMVERACRQDLPGRPPGHDAELATTLAEIVSGGVDLSATSAP